MMHARDFHFYEIPTSFYFSFLALCKWLPSVIIIKSYRRALQPPLDRVLTPNTRALPIEFASIRSLIHFENTVFESHIIDKSFRSILCVRCVIAGIVGAQKSYAQSLPLAPFI